jgi:hypothetical protein
VGDSGWFQNNENGIVQQVVKRGITLAKRDYKGWDTSCQEFYVVLIVIIMIIVIMFNDIGLSGILVVRILLIVRILH